MQQDSEPLRPNQPRERVAQLVQGALTLYIAYIGITSGLLDALGRLGRATADTLADSTGSDLGYVRRWCDAAYAIGLLEESEADGFRLTDLGQQFRPEVADTLMPFAVQAVLSAHMAERAAACMKSGERPGEQVLAERDTLLPWFGPMLEATYGPLLERQILPSLAAYQGLDRAGGTAVDLGCGNGWYLRRLARRFRNLQGIGLDAWEENIRQARERAAQEGLASRLRFERGDLQHFDVTEAVDLIAMNRALHHVWEQRTRVFPLFAEHLRPGGMAVIWEPNWPRDRAPLRGAGWSSMAFQNLAEHVQGNRFLHPEEIAQEFHTVGMEAEIRLFAQGREAVVVGTKRS